MHADVGGGYAPDAERRLASEAPLAWMIEQARAAGLQVEGHLADGLRPDPLAPLHRSRRHIYRLRRRYWRPLHPPGHRTDLHPSALERYRRDADYRPDNLHAHLEQWGWPDAD